MPRKRAYSSTDLIGAADERGALSFVSYSLEERMSFDFDTLLEQDDDTSKVQMDLKERLDRLSATGVVDIKSMCSPDRNSSTVDKLWTLNNILRLYEGGVGERSVINPIS